MSGVHCIPRMQVSWSRNLHYHDLVNPYHLKLASADTSGAVLVWDVSLATVRSTLTEPDRTLLGKYYQRQWPRSVVFSSRHWLVFRVGVPRT